MNNLKQELTELTEGMAEEYGYNLLDSGDVNKIFKQGKGDPAYEYLIENVISKVDDLTEEESNELREFMDTSINSFLTEATASADIAIYAGFQPILLRETFVRRIAKRLVTTEVTNELSPTYGVFKTIFIDKSGKEISLNEINTETDIDLGWYTETFDIDTGFEAFDASVLSPEDADVTTKILDLESKITSVFFGSDEVKCDIGIGYDGSVKGTVTFTPSGGGVPVTDVVHGMVDLNTGEGIFHSFTGDITKVNFTYRLTNTYSETNYFETRLEYTPETIKIGDGELIGFGIPMNYLSDIKAFGSVDGLAKAVETIAATHSVLNDRKILIQANNTADENDSIQWSKAVPAGTSIMDHNASLIFAINQAIATADNNTQFSAIRQFNISCNPIDANIVTSPVTINQAINDANVSVVGGSLNYKTTGIVSNSGDVNLLSSKLQAQGTMIVVPKSDVKEEKVLAEYLHSSTFYGDNSYRNPKYPNIKTVATRERRALKVHASEAIIKIEITS